MGADFVLQPLADGQVIGVFTTLDTVTLPLQGIEVEDITTPGVTDLTVVT